MKRILKIDKYALKDLHAVFGFDFTQDLFIFEYNKNFTTNQILQEIQRKYNTACKIVVLVKNSWNKDNYYIFELSTFGTVNNDFRFYNRHIDTGYKKALYDENRKKPDAHAIILCQKMDLLRLPKEKKFDTSERYKILDFMGVSDGKGNSWKYNRLTLKDPTTGKKIYYTAHQRTNNLTDIIDKSGYLLEDKRSDYTQKVKKLRYERQHADYIKTDNTTILNALQALFNDTKSKLIDDMQKATTAHQIQAISAKFASFHGLAYYARDLEILTRKDTEKSYSNTTQFLNEYNDIKQGLLELTLQEG